MQNSNYDELKLLGNLVDSIQQGVIILDKDLKIVKANKWIHSKVSGNTKILNSYCYEVFRGSNSPCHECPVLKTFSNAQPCKEILADPFHENIDVTYEITTSPILNESGKVDLVIENYNDITHLRNYEKSLTESEEKYKALYYNAPLAYQSLNNEGNIIDINPAWLNTLGYEREEVLGEWFGKFLHPDSIPHFKKNFPAFKKQGYIHNVEFRMLKKDQSEIYVSFEGCIGYNLDGSFKQTYCTFKDITTEKIAKDELIKAKVKAEKTEDKLSTIFNMSFSMICEADIHTATFKYINPAFKKVLGYDEEELLQKPFLNFIHPDDVAATIAVMEENLKAGIPVISFENRYKRKDGTYCSLAWNSFPKPEIGITYAIAHDISEQKKTEEELRLAKENAEENEILLRAAMENSHAGIAIADYPSGKLKYVNKAGLLMRGRNENEVVNNIDEYVSSWRILHFDGTPYKPDEVPLARAVLHGKASSKEFIIRRDNNEDRYVWANAAPIFNDKGEQTSAIVVFLDITDRKLAEFELKASKNEILLKNKISNAIILSNESDFYKSILDTVLETLDCTFGFFGYIDIQEEEEKLICPSLTFDVWENCKMPQKSIEFPKNSWAGIWGESLIHKKSIYKNAGLKLPVGHVQLKNALAVPIIYRNELLGQIAVANKPGGFNDTHKNILEEICNYISPLLHSKSYENTYKNELINAKEKAIESEKKLIEAQELSHVGSWEYIIESDKVIWSKELYNIFERPYNLPAPDYTQQDSFYSEESFEKLEKAVQDCIQLEIPFELELEIVTANGSLKQIISKGEVVKDKNGSITGCYGTAQDITLQKKLDLELIAAKEKAEEANRLKTEFLNNMSHEIRTPMNGIIGFSEMLDKPNVSDEKRSYYSKIVQSSSHQLLRIIDDILEIATLETKQDKIIETAFSLNDLMMELFSIFSLKAKERNIPIYLKKDLHADKSFIISDRTKLNKILGNLLENALKFTNEGFIEFGYKVEKQNLIIYVKDTGIGISPKNHKIIFERFSQENKEISRTHGGLGLGLSISKENAGLLGGSIFLESEKGKGSTFSINLPYKPAGSTAADVNNNISNIPLTKEEHTILIVEDEQVNFLYLEALFENETKNYYKIIHAKNGKEAVDICINNKSIDVILMDIKMPVMNGHEATEKIKENCPDLPIIAQTAYSAESDKQLALKNGFDDFISKPIQKENLFELIHKHLHFQ